MAETSQRPPREVRSEWILASYRLGGCHRKFGSGEHSDLDSVGRRFVSSLTGEVAIGNEIDDLDALVGGWG